MNSTARAELYCPSFYLSHTEIEGCGSLAYIERLYPASPASSASPSFLAIYFSSDELERILKLMIHRINNSCFPFNVICSKYFPSVKLIPIIHTFPSHLRISALHP